MTLLINEIHVNQNLNDSYILQIADRRITERGKYLSSRQKLFRIPYLNACVGYFGLAQISSKIFLSDWLTNFINKSNFCASLEEFSCLLCKDLNCSVEKVFIEKNVSGFQVCGYNNNNYPEMWFVRNFTKMVGNDYEGLNLKYEVDEEFLNSEAHKHGFNGKDPDIASPFITYYINGDVLPFHSIWLELDKFVIKMSAGHNIKDISTEKSIIKLGRWKMMVISTFYNQFTKNKIIGKPIDVEMLLPRKQ